MPVRSAVGDVGRGGRVAADAQSCRRAGESSTCTAEARTMDRPGQVGIRDARVAQRRCVAAVADCGVSDYIFVRIAIGKRIGLKALIH